MGQNRIYLVMWLLCCCVFAQAQVTLHIISVPENTGDSLFVAGNFNGWNPADNNYLFTKHGDNYTLIFMPADNSPLQFKITRGSWDKVESKDNGENIADRYYTYTPGAVIDITIAGWRDKFVIPQKKLNENILYTTLYSPQLQRENQLRILLPEDYATEKTTYPVIYMLDAQNLFDEATSYAGEWEIDETMHALFIKDNTTSIIVGIDHGNEKRMDEYNPWVDSVYGGGQGDACLDFLIETVKPFIDSAYRTQPQREHTYIAGSSLGGLMSYYAVLRSNDIFGNAFVFSPSFWIAPALYNLTDTIVFTGPTYVYFAAGGQEGYGMETEMWLMYEILTANNDANGHYRFIIEDDAGHNEAFWRKEFDAAYKWFFDK